MWQVLLGYDRWLPDWLSLCVILSVLAPWLGMLEYGGSVPRSRLRRLARSLLVVWLIDRDLSDNALWLPIAAVIAGLWGAQEIWRVLPRANPRRVAVACAVSGLALASLTSHVEPVGLFRLLGFALILAGIYVDGFLAPATAGQPKRGLAGWGPILRRALICVIVGGLVLASGHGFTYDAFFPLLAGGVAGWLSVCFICWRVCRTRPGRRPLLLRALSVVSWLFVGAWTAMLPLELYFRYGHDTTDAVGHIRISQRWVARHAQRNSWGLRDVEYEPLEQWRDRPRVLVLGDSIAFGWGINDASDMLGAQLERELASRSSPPPKVFTIACPGVGTYGEMKRFASQGSRLEPHVVVLAYCMNDITVGPPTRHSRSLPLLMPLMEASDFLEFFIWHLYHFLDLPPYRDRPSYLDAYADDEAFAQHTAEIDTLLAVIRESGARPIAVLFPFGKVATVDGPVRTALDRVSRVMRDRNVSVVDVSQLVDVTDTRFHVNAFDAHPNPDMLRAIVPTIANYVLETLDQGFATQPDP